MRVSEIVRLWSSEKLDPIVKKTIKEKLKIKSSKMFEEILNVPNTIRLPKWIQIKKVIEETLNVKTFLFKYPKISEISKPGQFVMVYIPSVDEIPMSLSHIDKKKGIVGITVAKVGEATTKLHKYQKGDFLGIRGPYGNGFKIVGSKVILVSGGVGIAPLFALSEHLSENKKRIVSLIIAGARTSNELLLVSKMKKICNEVRVTTDDGSGGNKGLVTDELEEVLKHRRYDQIYACGPDLMIKNVLEIADKYDVPLQASLERYIKCGRGICGQCCLDPLGLRVCTDGPVFSSEILRKITELGCYKRGANGAKVKINN